MFLKPSYDIYHLTTFVLLWLLVIPNTCIQSRGNDTSSSLLNIGVIGNGSSSIITEMVQQYTYNVSTVWHFVDTSEIFQIYRTICILADDADIDVVLLLGYNPAMRTIQEVMTPSNKQLITWSHIPYTQILQQTDCHGLPADECHQWINIHHTSNNPYCKTDGNASSICDRLYNQEAVTSVIHTAMADIVRQLTWKTVYVIYENTTEWDISSFVDILSTKGVKFVMYNFDTIVNIDATLLDIYSSSVRVSHEINFVVFCRFSCTMTVLHAVNQFDSIRRQPQTLMKQFSRWLIALYGHVVEMSRAIEACAHDVDNVVIMCIPGSETKSTEPEDFQLQLGNILRDVYIDRARGDISPEEDIQSILIDKIQQRASSWSTVLKCRGYYIDTLLWKQNGRQFNRVGYTDTSGNTILHSDLFPNTHFGFNGRAFLASTLPYGPFVIKRETGNETIYEGFAFDLLKQLALILNFTYTITEPKDGFFGTPDEKDPSIYNGLVGQLSRQEVDMVAGPLSVESAREKVIDFTYPIFHEYTTIVTKRSDGDTDKWRTLIDPLSWQVLLSIAIALPIATLIVFLLEKNNPYYSKPEHIGTMEKNDGLFYFPNAFWYMYGALLSQGGIHLPETVAGRTFVSCWWLFCIVMVGSYGGNLIAYLTVNKEKYPFESLKELLSLKDTVKWGVLGGSIWEVIFLSSTNPVFKAVGEVIRKNNQTDPGVLDPTPENHIARVLEGDYTWIGDETYIDIAMAKECELIKINDKFIPMQYAFAFPQNSPMAPLFSEQMMKIHEGGLFQIWKRKWWPKASFCKSGSSTGAKAISLVDVQSAFYVCLVGIFFGSVAILIECCVKAYHKRKMYRASRHIQLGDNKNETPT